MPSQNSHHRVQERAQILPYPTTETTIDISRPTRPIISLPSTSTKVQGSQFQTCIHSSTAMISPFYPSPSPSSINLSDNGAVSSNNHSSISEGAVIGIALGLTALVMLCGGGWFFHRRRRSRRQKLEVPEQLRQQHHAITVVRDRGDLRLSKSIHKPLDFSAFAGWHDSTSSTERTEGLQDYHEQQSPHQHSGDRWAKGTHNKYPLLPIEELYRTTAVVDSPLAVVTTNNDRDGNLPPISPVSPMGSVFQAKSLYSRISTLLSEPFAYLPPPTTTSMSTQPPPPVSFFTPPTILSGTSPASKTLETSTPAEEHHSFVSPLATHNDPVPMMQDQSTGPQLSSTSSGPRVGGRRASVRSRRGSRAQVSLSGS